MDTRESKIAWSVAGVLAVLLGVVAYLWYTTHLELADVLAAGREDIAAQQAQIREKCGKNDMASRAECHEALQSLASILVEFKDRLAVATTTDETGGE